MTIVTLITAFPRVVATGVATVVRMAGGGGRRGYFHKGEHWRAGVAAVPRFKAALGFDETGWTGGVVPTTGAVAFAPSRPADLAELAGFYWPGAAILVEDGDEDGTAFATRLQGTVKEAAVADGRLVLTIADLGVALTAPVVAARFAGTGGLEGGAEAKDAVKRRSWGLVFNVEGVIVDKANNIFQFGDPAFPLQSFGVVRDKGAEGVRSDLAWQGSADATLAALKASVPPRGGGVFAASIAMAKWWTQPAGPLTADLRGEIGPGYVETAPQIAARILATRAGAPAIVNLSASAAVRAGVAGLHVGDAAETMAGALDRLLLGVSLAWLLEASGTIRLRELAWTPSAGTLRSSAVTRDRTLPPVGTRRVGYRRSHRVHADGDLATVLLAQLDPGAADKLAAIEAGATRNVNRGDWAPDTDYAAGDSFRFAGDGYQVNVAHRSGGAAPDLAKSAIFVNRGAQGSTGGAGAAGSQGPTGPAGATLYTWIAYADAADGSVNFTTGVPGARAYIGLANNRATDVESQDPAAYVWSLIRGSDGVRGANGENGQPTYTWFAYADAADGSVNFTTGLPGLRTYLGLAANRSTAVESNAPADYAWSKIQGPQGLQGQAGVQGATGAAGAAGSQGPTGPAGATLYTWTAYATNADGTAGFAVGAADDTHTHIGISNNQPTSVEGTNPAAYTWSRMRGADGAQGMQGVPGTPGPDGAPTYTWFAYADAADGSVNFTTGLPGQRGFLGIAANKPTIAESQVPTDYAWSKIVGPQGPQGQPGVQGATGERGAAGAQGPSGATGAQGPTGASGATLYTWTAYATNADGTTGFVIGTPTDAHTHIGISNNQPTYVEGTNPAAYTWSRMRGADGAQGTQGVPGTPGPDGAPTYTWFAYADSANGVVDFTTGLPGNRRYLGIAANRATMIESNDPAQYFWSVMSTGNPERSIIRNSTFEGNAGEFPIGWERIDTARYTGAPLIVVADSRSTRGRNLLQVPSNSFIASDRFAVSAGETIHLEHSLQTLSNRADGSAPGVSLSVQFLTVADAAAAPASHVHRDAPIAVAAGRISGRVAIVAPPGTVSGVIHFVVDALANAAAAVLLDVLAPHRDEPGATVGATTAQADAIVEAKRVADDAKFKAEAAGLDGDAALLEIADFNENGKLTGREKIELVKIKRIVDDAYPDHNASAQRAGVSTAAHVAAYDALNAHLAAVAYSNHFVTTRIDRAASDAIWVAYYGARKAMLKAVEAELAARTTRASAAAATGMSPSLYIVDRFDVNAPGASRPLGWVGYVAEARNDAGLTWSDNDDSVDIRGESLQIGRAGGDTRALMGAFRAKPGATYRVTFQVAPRRDVLASGFYAYLLYTTEELAAGITHLVDPAAPASLGVMRATGHLQATAAAMSTGSPAAATRGQAILNAPLPAGASYGVIEAVAPAGSRWMALEFARYAVAGLVDVVVVAIEEFPATEPVGRPAALQYISPTSGKTRSSLFFHTSAAAGIRKLTTAGPTAAIATDGTATISVPAHTQGVPGEFGEERRSYAAATIVGKALDTLYTLYVIDPGFVGGALPVYATTNGSDVAQAGAALIGSVRTPAAGQPPTTGGGGTGGEPQPRLGPNEVYQ